MSDLEHTERIARMLRDGRRRQAIAAHNAHVQAELDRARAGAVINLSDLMAAHEEILTTTLTPEQIIADAEPEPDPERCDTCGALELCDCRVYPAAYGRPYLP
jgi:hypothetical protein